MARFLQPDRKKIRAVFAVNFILCVALLCVQFAIYAAQGLTEVLLVYETAMLFSVVFALFAWSTEMLWLLLPAEIGPIACIVFSFFVRLHPVALYVWGALDLLAFAVLCFWRFRFGDAAQGGGRRQALKIIAVLCTVVLAGIVLVSNLYAVYGSDYRSLPLQQDGYYTQACEEGGAVQRFEYSAHIYGKDGVSKGEQIKYCYVYTPYGYTEGQQYDILYLMHGGHEGAEQWMVDGRMSFNKNVVDHLIADGAARPMIIVMPSFYYYNDYANELNVHTSRSDSDKADYVELPLVFQYELRNDLMPAVEKAYSTYANGETTDEAFIASRDHRGFAGLSMGSMTTIKSALCASLDRFSWFAPFSGTNTTAECILSSIQENGFGSYPINYIYFATGSLDHCYRETKLTYLGLLESDAFTEGKNISLSVIPYQTHYDYQWPIDLFNALQVLFW